MLKDINDPAVEEEMERELNTIAKLDHENIVRIYGVFSVADTGNTGKLNTLCDSQRYTCRMLLTMKYDIFGLGEARAISDIL